jgi:Flp pilus assembly protein TadG
MRKRKKALLRSGAAALEFALVAPIFFLMIFGLIEIGRMMMVQQSLTNAAREGCRSAVLATSTNSADVEAVVRNYLKSAMNVDHVRITSPSDLANADSDSELSVVVEVAYRDVSWLPWDILGLNPAMRAEQIGRRE